MSSHQDDDIVPHELVFIFSSITNKTSLQFKIKTEWPVCSDVKGKGRLVRSRKDGKNDEKEKNLLRGNVEHVIMFLPDVKQYYLVPEFVQTVFVTSFVSSFKQSF